MNKNVPTGIVRLADAKQISSFLEIIRGGVHRGRQYAGLIEQQHPLLWALPSYLDTLQFLCVDGPRLANGGAEERVLRALIGHTWNFRKAAEAVTYEQLLRGKSAAFEGRLLAAPAFVSKGSLSKALNSIASKGLAYRLEMSPGVGWPLIMYFPNPLCTGRTMHYGKLPDEKHLGKSTYRGETSELLMELKHQLVSPFERLAVTSMYEALLGRLRHPELVAAFIEHFAGQIDTLLDKRRKCREKLSETPGPLEAPPHVVREQEPQEAELAAHELHWFRSEVVEDFAKSLDESGKWLNAGADFSEVEQVDQGQAARLLLHRWGVPLLSTSPKAWRSVWKRRDSLPEYLQEDLEATQKFSKPTWPYDLSV